MEPQQWMEHEWIAQVTTQEEETEWSPSPAQQKLHARPRRISKRMKNFLINFMYVALYGATYILVMALLLGLWALWSGTNNTLAINLVGWSVLLLGVIGLVIWWFDPSRPKNRLRKEENNTSHPNTSTAPNSAQVQVPQELINALIKDEHSLRVDQYPSDRVTI